MSLERDTLNKILNELHPQLDDIQNSILELPEVNKDEVSRCFSNTDLLIKTLKDFYADSGRADYFPNSITKQIAAYLNSLNQAITSYKAVAPILPNAKVVLDAAELCYVFCLQYGIITFGFEDKVKLELFEKARDVNSKYQKLLKKAESNLKELEDALKKEIISFKEPLSKDVQELQSNVKSIVETLNTELQETQSVKENLISEIEKVNTIFSSIAKKDVEADGLSKEIDSIAKSSTKEYDGLKALATEAKTAVDLIKENRTAMKEQLDEIKAFFSEIELYQKKMTDIKKESNDKFNKLTADYEEKIIDFNQATANIITTNEELQKSIKEHLTKAIGVSLFSAFDARRTNLKKGTDFWSRFLIIAVLLGISITMWIGLKFEGKPDAAFYVKLSAIIPVAFLIGFSAKQYSNERRAEEEYAFKSAISISLEPYRDLLFKIRTENPDIDTAFIEELIFEIFDNPVKRIYSGKSSDSIVETTTGINTNDLLEKITDKFSTEQIKELKEFIEKLTTLIKIKK